MALATSNWVTAVPFALEVHGHEFAELVPAADALAQLGDTAVGYPLMVQQSITTLMSWPRPVALAIVQGLLGDTSDQLPADRELTTIEDVLFEFFLKDLLAGLAGNVARPDPVPVAIRAGRNESCAGGNGMLLAQTLIVANFRLACALGEQRWQWLMPAKAMVELLNPSLCSPATKAVLCPNASKRQCKACRWT